MAYPNPYGRQYDFTDYQSSHPSDPLPGLQVDSELDTVLPSLNDTITFIKIALNEDGAIKNASVTADMLTPGLLDDLAAGLDATMSGYVADAQAAAVAAAASRDSAAISESNSHTSSVNAAASANTASTQATASGNSATASAASAVDSASSATDAETAQTAAELAETNVTSLEASCEGLRDECLGYYNQCFALVSAASSHVVDYENPHKVTSDQVGRYQAVWNAGLMQGTEISSEAPEGNYILYFDAVTQLASWGAIGDVIAEAISTFIGLSDTPANYVGQDGKYVVVNSAEDGVEFIDHVTEFLDGAFRVNNTIDTTKQIDFDASAITTSTIRTLIMPDNDVTLAWLGQDVNAIANPEFASLQLTPRAAMSHSEGQQYYDNASKAITYFNDEVDIAIKTGREVNIRVYNDTGSTITKGSIVYPNGVDAVTDLVTINLADASVKEKCRLVGMARHDIEDGSVGYVSRIGEIDGLDTSAYSGGVVYLSATTPGAFTNTPPSGGNYITAIGAIKEIDAVTGSVVVDPTVSQLTVEITDTNGFPADQKTGTTLSFVNGTRTLSIAPTGAKFHYYQIGDKYEKTTTQSVVITNVEGLHIVYFDGDTLTSVASPTDAQIDTITKTKVLVAYVYWDASSSVRSYFGEERHGISMSPETHAYLHFTRGAQFFSGLGIGDLSTGGDGSIDAHAQFSVEGGVTTDEDLQTTSPAIASTVGLPIYYLDGAAVNTRRTTLSGFSVLTDVAAGVGATGRLVFNEFTGGAWQLTTLTDNYHVLCHVFQVNGVDGSDKQIAIIGTNQYAQLKDAQNGASEEIVNIRSDIPFEEMVPVATIIFKSRNLFSNAVKAATQEISVGVDYIDWRVTELAQGSTAAAHANLTGLGNDDHLQYALLAGRSGGQSLVGGTDSGDDLNLSSTSNATKGNIGIGSNSTYDEVNDRLGIGTTTPDGVIDATPDTIDTDSYTYGARVTQTQMDNMVGMATGAEVFNTTENKPYFYNGAEWIAIGGGSLDGTDKRLGVARISSADTDTDIYSPATGYAVGVKIVIFNDNTVDVAKVQLINRDGVKADDDHLLYDISIGPQSEPIVVLIPGIKSTETLTARSSVTNVNFAAFGQEVTTDEGTYCTGRHEIAVVDTDEDLISFTGEDQADIFMCNRSASETATVLIKVTDGAVAADEDKVYSKQIFPNQSKVVALDFNVANTYKIVVQSDTLDVNFQAYSRAKSEFEADMILPPDVQLKRAKESGLFKLSTQVDPGAGNPIRFDTVVTNDGVEFDSANYRWKIKKGKRYLLRCSTRTQYIAAEGTATYQWYDETATSYIGHEAVCYAVSASSYVTNQGETFAIITPDSDRYVHVRHTSDTSLTQYKTTGSFVEIQEVSPLVDYVKNPHQVDYYQKERVVTGANWTTIRAVFRDYKDPNGVWCTKFNICGSLSAGASSLTLTASNVTFKTTDANTGQAITASLGDDNSHARVQSNSSDIYIETHSARTYWACSGDVELNAQPTDL